MNTTHALGVTLNMILLYYVSRCWLTVLVTGILEITEIRLSRYEYSVSGGSDFAIQFSYCNI